MNYTWTCYDLSTFASCTNSSGHALELPSVSKLTLPAKTLSSGDYIIRLWLICPTDGRNATASVDLSLEATAVPVVGMNALTVTKVNNNAGTYLQLGGNIVGDPAKYGTITYEWTLTSGDEPTADSGWVDLYSFS